MTLIGIVLIVVGALLWLCFGAFEELDASSDHRVEQSAGTQPPPDEGLTAVPADLILTLDQTDAL